MICFKEGTEGKKWGQNKLKIQYWHNQYVADDTSAIKGVAFSFSLLRLCIWHSLRFILSYSCLQFPLHFVAYIVHDINAFPIKTSPYNHRIV